MIMWKQDGSTKCGISAQQCTPTVAKAEEGWRDGHSQLSFLGVPLQGMERGELY